MASLPANVTATTDLTASLSLTTKSLFNANTGTGAGHIAFDSNLQDQLATVNALRNNIIDYIRLRLGDGIIDIEADKEHFDMGVDQALLRYRQRSANSVEESYAFLDIYPETQEYILPQEIMNVRGVYRRGIGSVTGSTASQFEPFASGYLNTYMLVAGRVGGLANYELFAGYQEQAMKMFGGYIQFSWNRVTKKIIITRKIPFMGQNAVQNISESVLLHIDNYKPNMMLLNDPQAFPWIQDYAYALVMMSIGQAREKFATINGPQGGTSLNGTALKAEGQALLDKLEEDIRNYVDGGMPMTWITG
jgi:hypothetical protein